MSTVILTPLILKAAEQLKNALIVGGEKKLTKYIKTLGPEKTFEVCCGFLCSIATKYPKLILYIAGGVGIAVILGIIGYGLFKFIQYNFISIIINFLINNFHFIFIIIKNLNFYFIFFIY